MKNPSSRSIWSPQSGQALLTSNKLPLRKSVAPPQLGHRLRNPRAATMRRETFTEAPWPLSGAELVPDKPADLDVLPGLRDRLGEKLLHGLIRRLDERLVQEADVGIVLLELPIDNLLGGRRRLSLDLRRGDLALLGDLSLRHLVAGDVERAGCRDLEAQVLDEGLEAVVAGDKVGLAVDLDQDPDLPAVVDVALDQALLRGAVGLLGGGCGALLAEDRRGLLRVSIGLDEGLLAVEEPCAGLAAQCVDHLGGDGSAHVIQP